MSHEPNGLAIGHYYYTYIGPQNI